MTTDARRENAEGVATAIASLRYFKLELQRGREREGLGGVFVARRKEAWWVCSGTRSCPPLYRDFDVGCATVCRIDD